MAADGQDRQKVSIIEPAAEYSVIHNGTQLWAYDSASDQAYHQTLTAQDAKSGHAADTAAAGRFPDTPQAAAQQVLKAARGTASITVDGTAEWRATSAYELLITPQHADTTTVGSIRIAVDSKTGVPLKLTLTPRGGGKAVFDIGFTKVSFSAPAASTFTFSPPKGVKVTEGAAKPAPPRRRREGQGRRRSRPCSARAGTPSRSSSRPAARCPAARSARTASPGKPGMARQGGGDRAESMLNSFGTPVTGPFGSGTFFHTRLVNALITDNGTVYVGAVSRSALTDAADAAK